MTIVAGFKCADGVVLCADTQETFQYTKTHVPKLRFFPTQQQGIQSGDLVAAFAGAGDSGPFIDKVIEHAWRDAQIATSFEEACIAVEESIKNTHREYGEIYQIGFLPLVRLVYGVAMDGKSKLFSSDGPTVCERDTYDSHGTGDAITKFITAQMYSPMLSVSQLAILAAYSVYEAKKHADGCGGETHIAELSSQGISRKITADEIKWIEEHFVSLESCLGLSFLMNADLNIADDTADMWIELLTLTLKDARKTNKENKDRAAQIRKRAQQMVDEYKARKASGG